MSPSRRRKRKLSEFTRQRRKNERAKTKEEQERYTAFVESSDFLQGCSDQAVWQARLLASNDDPQDRSPNVIHDYVGNQTNNIVTQHVYNQRVVQHVGYEPASQYVANSTAVQIVGALRDGDQRDVVAQRQYSGVPHRYNINPSKRKRKLVKPPSIYDQLTWSDLLEPQDFSRVNSPERARRDANVSPRRMDCASPNPRIPPADSRSLSPNTRFPVPDHHFSSPLPSPNFQDCIDGASPEKCYVEARTSQSRIKQRSVSPTQPKPLSPHNCSSPKLKNVILEARLDMQRTGLEFENYGVRNVFGKPSTSVGPTTIPSSIRSKKRELVLYADTATSFFTGATEEKASFSVEPTFLEGKAELLGVPRQPDTEEFPSAHRRDQSATPDSRKETTSTKAFPPTTLLATVKAPSFPRVPKPPPWSGHPKPPPPSGRVAVVRKDRQERISASPGFVACRLDFGPSSGVEKETYTDATTQEGAPTADGTAGTTKVDKTPLKNQLPLATVVVYCDLCLGAVPPEKLRKHRGGKRCNRLAALQKKNLETLRLGQVRCNLCGGLFHPLTLQSHKNSGRCRHLQEYNRNLLLELQAKREGMEETPERPKAKKRPQKRPETLQKVKQ